MSRKRLGRFNSMSLVSKNKTKIVVILSLIIIIINLFISGAPTNIDDHFINFLKKKDIYTVLIGTLISNIIAKNLNTISENLFLPYISLISNTDLTKPIKYNGVVFNTKKIISSLIGFLVSGLFIVVSFRNIPTQ
jgi:hypothetical protein